MVLDPLLGHKVEVGLLQAEHWLRLEVPVMTGRSMVVVRVVVMREIAVIVVVAEVGSIRSTAVTARVVRIVTVEHRVVLVQRVLLFRLVGRVRQVEARVHVGRIQGEVLVRVVVAAVLDVVAVLSVMVHVQLVLVLQGGTVAQVVLLVQVATRLAGRTAHATGLCK